jgi:hypothetical protein
VQPWRCDAAATLVPLGDGQLASMLAPVLRAHIHERSKALLTKAKPG